MLHETGETLLSENRSSRDDPRNVSPTIAPLPPPETADIIAALKSQFEKNLAQDNIF